MNWKQYRYEIILAVTLLFAFGSYVYKHIKHDTVIRQNREAAKEIVKLQEAVALKKLWGDKRISQKIEAIRSMVPSSKLKWRKNGKKLTMDFSGLQPNELNKVIGKIFNIPVQILSLKVDQKGDVYNMEIRCKW